MAPAPCGSANRQQSPTITGVLSSAAQPGGSTSASTIRRAAAAAAVAARPPQTEPSASSMISALLSARDSNSGTNPSASASSYSSPAISHMATKSEAPN